MDDVVHAAWVAVKAVYPVALLVLSVRGLALWGTDRLRVTDWLGYVILGLFLAAGLIQLGEGFGPWGVVPALLGVGGGLVWVRRDQRILRDRDRGDGQEILGFFLVSRHRVPVGVRNWFD
jgi:hypothetical protein